MYLVSKKEIVTINSEFLLVVGMTDHCAYGVNDFFFVDIYYDRTLNMTAMSATSGHWEAGAVWADILELS